MTDRASFGRHFSPLLVLASLAACTVVPPAAPPSAPPPPRPAPPPPPPPPVAVAPEQPWDVAALSPGDWSYKQDQQGRVATFGPRGTQGSFEIRCRSAARQISVTRLGSVGRQVIMTIRTSDGTLSWPATPSPDGLGAMTAVRPASDAGLDWIAFSRGRISVELPGLPRLIVPVWAEISRVIEDCRG